MKLIITLILLLIAGCSTTQQKNLVDTDYLMNEITVTRRIAIPGTNQYCEVDNDKLEIVSCVPIKVYSETEE